MHQKEEEKRVQELIRMSLLSKWLSFLEIVLDSRRLLGVSSYLALTIQPLHNPHLGVFNLAKKCSVSYCRQIDSELEEAERRKVVC